ncbi:TetR/AcrR family transcriptional regulator [Actinoallomurus sp. NPDC050550]|uniref:TetR/AcrR family transcriptional regulator n=1 Tax=Actinoallomurus sp. NPDC050550 TaxID=3154937 RepID=UPI0033DA57A7
MGLRERKKHETRAALSRATIRLSLERGWDNVTVEDIAAEANVSVRTFRNYFSSKAEAFVAQYLDRMLRVADDLRARPADEPLSEAVVDAVQARFSSEPDANDGYPRSREWADDIRLMLTEPDVQGAFLRAGMLIQHELAKAIAERTGTDLMRDVYPNLVAAATGAATTVAMDHWLSANPPVEIGPLLREVLDRLWVGLSAPERDALTYEGSLGEPL